ncbi:MAG: hypothetical protein EBU96_01240 [Actinobacteria bacterium]|nr:hypothetical protein [Actinomycetota bacterium]
MDDTPFINDGADTSLRKTVSLLNKMVGFSVPPYDEILLSNYDVNGNVGTVSYRLNGNVVATITLTYTAGKLTSVLKN